MTAHPCRADFGPHLSLILPTGKVPDDLWPELEVAVQLEPEPALLADWKRQLEIRLGVTDGHRRAVSRAQPWALLKVTAQQERYVVEALNELGVPAYAPKHITAAKHAKRKATRTRALIPGYVFAQVSDDDSIDAALSVRGVREIMCREGRVRAVRAIDVGSLVLAEAFHLFDETWERPPIKGRRYSHRWQKDETVRIDGGPFDGFIAQVLRTHNRNRIDVLLSLFGRATEISVKSKELRALS